MNNGDQEDECIPPRADQGQVDFGPDSQLFQSVLAAIMDNRRNDESVTDCLAGVFGEEAKSMVETMIQLRDVDPQQFEP